PRPRYWAASGPTDRDDRRAGEAPDRPAASRGSRTAAHPARETERATRRAAPSPRRTRRQDGVGKSWSAPLTLVLQLSHLPHHAVGGELERSRGGVMFLAVLRRAAPHPHFLADVVLEQLQRRPRPSQRDERVGLERPVVDGAVGVLDVDME